MPNTSKNLLDYIHCMVGVCRDDPRDDTQLLTRFVEGRDERAFTTLLGRHGPLVWRTCTQVLGDGPEAEDAFQTAFLALARKANQLRGDTLAGWLHRVARQTAVKADIGARRQRSLEQRLQAVSRATMTGDADQTELYAALDEELAELPEQLRVPLLLRYFEGKSQDDVAHILDCSRFVVRTRLARGEAILRKRLERRGLEVGVVSVAALLGSTVTASVVPTRLIGSTVRAALRTLSFPPFESFPFAALAEGVVKTMVETKMKIVTVLLGVTLCLAGGSLLAYQILAGNVEEPSQPADEVRGRAEASRQLGTVKRVDCYGDPLPAHAVARMGTTRLWGHGKVLAFSPDGKTLASSHGTAVCLWDAATGKEIRRLTAEANKRGTLSLGFSRDGKTLVAVDWEQTVYRWDVATGRFLRKQEYQGPKRTNVQCHKVAFLSDSKMLGFGDFWKSAEEGRGMYVWDVATGKEMRLLGDPMKRGLFHAAVFSSDGSMLATVRDSIIYLWDVATGKEIRELKDNTLVSAMDFARDGKMLASVDGNKISIWEIATGKKIHLLSTEGAHRGPLVFFPDGKTLLGGEGGDLFDLGTGKKIRSFNWEGARAQVALFSPEGKILAEGDETGSVRLWEVATGKEIGPRQGVRGSIHSIAYFPDGKTLASLGSPSGFGGNEKMIRLWEVATGKEIRQLAKGTSGFLAYSPDGKTLVSRFDPPGTVDRALHLWDIATDKEIRLFKAEDFIPESATFSPDSKKLVAIVSDGKMTHLWVWEVATGKKIYAWPTGPKNPRFNGNAESLAFSPDGRLLAAQGRDNTVSLWEMATGTLLGQLGPKKLAQQEQFVRFLTFCPDNRILAVSSLGDDKIHLWEVATGKEIRQLDGYSQPKGPVSSWYGCSLAFSPCGRMLATAAHGGRDGAGKLDWDIRLWEVASGKEIGRLPGHQAHVRTLTFSPDGMTLTSGSNDLTCLIWDVTPFKRRLKHIPAAPINPRVLSKEQLEAAWNDLAKDAAKAYAAIGVLQAVPTQAISLLQTRVHPVVPLADPKQLQRWIADLDDNNFTVRDKARREIEKLGELTVPFLQQALKGQPALETKKRLQDLLAELEPQEIVVSPKRLHELRAVQLLEYIGTAKARQVLQTLAKGVAGAGLTVEAEAALTRLAKRSVASP